MPEVRIMMKKKYSLILIVVLVCFAVTFQVSKKCLVASKRSLTFGTAAAINAALFTELDRDNATLKEILSYGGEEWRFVNDDQYDKIVIELAKWHNLDAPKNWDSSGPFLDIWGNRFEIGYRKLPSNGYDFIIVSKGPDGIYGTNDDVVSPSGIISPVRSPQ